MTTGYKLLHALVNRKSNSVTFIYSIFESDAAGEFVDSDIIMTKRAVWRVIRWVNGRQIPKMIFSTRFY